MHINHITEAFDWYTSGFQIRNEFLLVTWVSQQVSAYDNFCVKWTQTTARFFRMVYSRILISILCQIEWLCQSYRSTSMFCWYRPSIESKLRKRRLNQKYMGFRWYGARKRFDSPMFMKARQYILIFLWVHVASLAQCRAMDCSSIGPWFESERKLYNLTFCLI